MLKLLPQLDDEHSAPVPTGGDGNWDRAGGGIADLAKYADALKVPATDTSAEHLKSVPTPWARALLFEQALFSHQHPVHRQVRDEWRGLLGLLGLQSYLGLSPTVETVTVNESDGVIQALWLMRPQDGDSSVWGQLGLIRMDGALIGATSPRTLFFTGIRGQVPGSVPFAQRGRFRDPGSYYLSVRDSHSLGVLAAWLTSFRQELKDVSPSLDALLGRRPSPTQAMPVSRAQLLFNELEEWDEEVRQKLRELDGEPINGRLAKLTVQSIFPSGSAAAAVYSAVRALVPDEASLPPPNDLKLVDGDWLVDPGAEGVIRKDGQPFNGVIRLPNGQARQTVQGKFTPPLAPSVLGANAVNPGRLFQPSLLQVAGRDDTVAVLSAQGRDFLIPFSADILRYLPPDQLAELVTIVGDPATGLRVALEVPLSGGLTVRYERRYDATSIESDLLPPQLLAWPDFESSEWHHYHYLSFQRSTRGRLLSLAPVAATDSDGFSEFTQPAGPAHWWSSTQPTRAWSGTFAGNRGLLLSRPLTRATPVGAEWDLAIDFGSTNTRVFRAAVGAGGAKTSAEIRFQNRTISLIGGASGMDSWFLSGPDQNQEAREEVPSVVWFPLLQPSGRAEGYLPADGIIQWNYLNPPYVAGGLRGNLKWQSPDGADRAAFESFINHLYLGVSAEAAAQGAHVKSFVTAYPSVLPNWLRISHRQAWRALAARFGVELRQPISESAAVAKYFVGQGAPAHHLLAIDIGGSTSDIAVWSGGRLVANDSVKLAGDILGRLVGRDAMVREAVAKAVRTATLKERAIGWSDEDESLNRLILNSLLRKLSIQGQTLDLASNLGSVGPRSAAERVLAHAGYLFAILAYILGMVIRRLKLDSDRYDLRLAGKASGLLRWVDVLAPGGAQSLTESFFRSGLDASGPVLLDITIPGTDAKEEVGRGLLESVAVDVQADERRTIVGESGFAGPHGVLQWDDELSVEVLEKMPEPASPVSSSQLVSLRRFVETFDQTEAGRVIARCLDLSLAKLSPALDQQIHGALFGPASAYRAVRSGPGQDAAVIEPVFLTEAKVLLEHVTNNHGLFRD